MTICSEGSQVAKQCIDKRNLVSGKIHRHTSFEILFGDRFDLRLHGFELFIHRCRKVLWLERRRVCAMLFYFFDCFLDSRPSIQIQIHMRSANEGEILKQMPSSPHIFKRLPVHRTGRDLRIQMLDRLHFAPKRIKKLFSGDHRIISAN